MTQYVITGRESDKQIAPYTYVTSAMSVGQMVDLTLSTQDESTLIKAGMIVPASELPDDFPQGLHAIDFTHPRFGGSDVGGTWDTAFNEAVAALGNDTSGIGGALTAPPGLYVLNNMLQLHGGQYLVGPGRDYAGIASRTAQGKGLIIQASSSFPSTDPLVKFGTTQYNSSNQVATMADGLTSGGAFNVVFDAATFAHSAAQTFGARNQLVGCNFLAGSSYAVDIRGQNTRMLNCVADNWRAAGTSATVYVGSGADDTKLWLNEIRRSDGPSLIIDSVQNVQVIGGDIFGAPLTTTAAVILFTATGANAVCNGDIRVANVDVSAASGDLIAANTTATGQVIGPINIIGVRTYENPGGFFGYNSSAGGAVKNVSLVGNMGLYDGTSNGANILVSGHASSTISGLLIVDNHFQRLATGIVNGTAVPTICRNNVWTDISGNLRASEDSGVATISGDGATTAFTINHKMGAAPTHFAIQGAQNTATATAIKNGWWWTATSSAITVNFQTAPASGTNNIVFNWDGSLF